MKKLIVFLVLSLSIALFFPSFPLHALEIQTMTTYHENGKMKERYSYFSDESNSIWKHGLYTSCHYLGQLDEIMSYEYNSRHGSYTRYHYSGDMSLSSIEQGTYESGKKMGVWNITPVKTDGLQGRYEYAEYGNLIIRQMEQRRYENGNQAYIEKCELKSGRMFCTRTDYYAAESGKVSAISSTEPDGFARRVEGYHLNGARSYAGIKAGDVFQGRWTYWADDGFLIRQTDFVDGKKHGIEIEYPAYEVSRIKDKIIGEFRYGARHGDSKRYGEDGSLSYHYRYADGFQEGEQLEYWGSLTPGKLSKKSFMKGGVQQGLQELYYKSGTVSARGQFVDGKLEGVWEQFYEDGGISLRCNYRLGELHGRFESFHDNGQMAFRVDYEKGKANGDAKSWYENGALESVITYVDGIKHGPAYFNDIQFYRQGSYANGGVCGTWTKGYMPGYGSDPPWTEEYVSCDSLHVADPETPYDPNPPANAREIRGRAIRDSDGKPVSGVQVYAGTGDPPAVCYNNCVTTDNTGYYRLLLTEAGSYPLQFIGGGYYSHKETADMTNRDYLTVNVRLKSMPPAQYGTPAITKFTSRYGGVFLSGIPINNTYTAAVNWSGGTPGTLRFTKNGTSSDSGGAAEGGSRTYNMGGDFIAGLSAGANTLTVEATGIDGKKSPAVTLHPLVIPTPAWSVGLGDFTVKEEKGAVTYGIGKTWPAEPAEPFTVQINPETLGEALWTAWGFFPLVGGKEFGIPPTRFQMGVSAGTDGAGSVSLGGTTGFAAAGGLIEGTVNGTGKVRYESGKGLAFAGATLNAGIKGSVKREVGPVTLIPALGGATEWRYVGDFFKWFNNTAKIDGTISVGTDLTLGIADNNGLIGFQPAEGAITTGVELGVGSEVEGFKTRLSGGGSGKIMWQIPANPGYYKSSEFTLNAKLDVNWKIFKFTLEDSHVFPRTSTLAVMALDSPAGFGPVPRTFLELGPYNKFVAPTTKPLRSLLTVRSPLEITSGTVVTNIYPYAGPAIAERNSHLAMAYVYNDPNDQNLQATEIYVLDWENGAYTAPAPILNDTRAEFSPVLAFDLNSALICAWERVKDENFTGTGDGISDMERMAADMEIVYAVRDPNTGLWSAPIPLTDNDYLDHGPMLARAPNGSAIIMWRSNAQGALAGKAGAPTRMHAAFWNPATRLFSTPADIGYDFINATQFSLAYKGNEAALAYVQDMDGDMSTTADQDIALLTFDGSAWSSPAAVTADALSDVAPQALYDLNGALQLAWRKGTDLVRRTDNAGAYEIIRTGSSGISFANFRFFCNSDNRLVVIWQDISNGKTDLFYIARDAATGSWSSDLRLTDNAEIEQDAAGVFDATGALHLVFAREIMTTGQTDLHHLTYSLGGDLAISESDIIIAPVVPVPGSQVTLRAAVRNAGDTAYSNVPVSFYLGDPASGGELIGTATATPAEIKGGTKGEATISWTAPENRSSCRIYVVVDQNNILTEANESNNKAFFEALKPDLEMLSTRVEDLGDGSVDVMAILHNSGSVPAAQVGVLFFAGNKELGYAEIPQIDPGKTAEISRRCWAGTDFSGSEILFETTADPDNKIVEISEANNRSGAVFIAAPVATVVTDALVFDPLSSGNESAPMFVNIRNPGGADLLISAIQLSDAANFRIDLTGGAYPLGASLPATVPSGQSRTIAVILAPTADTVPEVQLSIMTNDPDLPVISLPVRMGTFTVSAPRISATPGEFAFGEIIKGAAAPVVMASITNTGSADLTISGLNLDDTANFHLDANAGNEPLGTPPVVLPPGAYRTMSLRYSPLNTGDHAAQLTISSDDAASPALILPLSGTGILSETAKPQALALTPQQYYFGVVAPGSDSEPLTVFIANYGGAPLTISGINLSESVNFQVDQAGGSNPVGSLPAVIPAGENRTATVVFSPTGTAGYASELLVTSDDPANPEDSVFLTGNDPLAGAANIVVSPMSLDFGAVDQGTTSDPKAVIISNNGGRELRITNISLNLNSDNAFIADANGGANPLGQLPASIPAGQNRTIAVTFSPDASVTYNRSLSVFSSDPDMPELSVALSGIGKLKPGDLNGDGKIDLTDAIQSLRAPAGMTADSLISGYSASGADVDGDGKVGMAETIFILQNLAGLRMPESDHPYADGEDKKWSYTLPGNPSAIMVTFDSLTEAENNRDYIHISNWAGNPIEGSPFTGTSLAGQTVNVSGDTVKIRLVSDNSNTYWGFKIIEITAASE